MLADKLRAASSARPLPVFVSSSILRSLSSNPTVTAPASIQNGDLLVAVGYNAAVSASITLPTGFTTYFYDAGGNGSLFVATKTAASESGNYDFSWGATGSNTISILVYRNATRINTVGNNSNFSVATHTAASITPTYTGTLCAVFVGEAGLTISTAPSGMTQRSLQNAGSPSLAVYDLSSQNATATSSYSLTWSTAATGTAIQFQVTNEPDVTPAFVASASTQSTASGSSLVINKPAGTIDGDLMIAVNSTSGLGTVTWTGDTGWTEVADQNAVPNLRIAYKVAASEGSSYTFTTSGTNVTTAGAILTYRYASYGGIGSFTTNANPLSLSSVTTTSSQAVLIAAVSRLSANITLVAPSDMTARVTDNDATGPSYIVADRVISNGPSGTRSITTGTTSNVVGIMLFINPTRSL